MFSKPPSKASAFNGRKSGENDEIPMTSDTETATEPGLYVHVPFCIRKCAYCDFASEAPPNPVRIERYLDALEIELGSLPDDFHPATVFIGGGTPTALGGAALDRLLSAVRTRAPNPAEWTCEANPGTVSPDTAARLAAGGVNRISLGAPSFDPSALALLGRAHTAEAIAESVSILRAAGLANLSLDLIYGVPGRGIDTLASDLDRLLALAPEHISAYLLSIEAGTPLAARVSEGSVDSVSDDDALAQFDAVRARLKAAGYGHYEISNFARPGLECRHNLLYWSGGEYLGVGPAAHSHWHGARWGNVLSLEAWADALSKGWNPRAFEERLAPEARARETLVFSLRRLAGVRRAEFRANTGFDLDALCGDTLDRLARDGLLVCDNDAVRLSDRALFISDAVFAELV